MLSKVAPVRDVGIDALRIVAITAVVLAHVWTASDVVRAATYSWHVPVFFFLSGYFWSQPRTIASELRTRWRTLGVPYVAWLVVITLALVASTVLAGGIPSIDWGSLLSGGARLGRPYTTFWFVSALFFAAIAYRVMQRLPLWAKWLVAIATYSAALLFPEAARSIPLAVGTGLACLIFMVAGTTFRRYRHLLPRPLVLAIAGLVASGALLALRVTLPPDLKQAYVGTPVLAAVVAITICASLVIIFDRIFARAPNAVGVLVVRVAEAGLFVVLSHPIVLWLLNTGAAGSWSGFILALGLPWIAGLLIILTPAAPILAGVRRRPLRAPQLRSAG